jgi:predicted AAA+ superfamily ATPase
VGVAGAHEVDFVAEGAQGRVYVQVSYLIESPETLEREKSALLGTGDAHAKVMLSLNPVAPGPLDGIRHINLVDFLYGAALPTD